MADLESLDYLKAGFEPSSLTVPHLRSILVQHDIEFPSSAKKSQLIDIFNEQLIPHARRLLRERAKVRRMSKGIVDADSQESTVSESIEDEEETMPLPPTPRARSTRGTRKSAFVKESESVEDEESMPPPPTPRARSTRGTRKSAFVKESESVEDEESMPPPPTPRVRSTRGTRKSAFAKESESESEVAAPVSAKRTRSPTKRTSSAKHARASDTDTADLDGVRKSVRKSRRSEAPVPVPVTLPPPRQPKIKQEDFDDGAGVMRKDPRRESAFTYDNPFQSGSSPPRVLSTEKKRKSYGASVSASKERASRKSSISRRGTEHTDDDNFHPPTSSTFELPLSAIDGLKDVDENGVEASEEFTPEEQMEMIRDRSVNGLKAVGPLRPKRKAKGINWKGPIWVAALTLFGGYATWYRQEKVAVGYCGVGREATQIIPDGLQVPDWVRVLAEPQCEMCPQHAYCSGHMDTHCEADYVLRPHPLALGGLVPVAPTCEPDGAKVRKVSSIADRAVQELRQRRAMFECGELTDEAGVPEPMVEIDADVLKKEVSKKKIKKMSTAEFEELWGSAIGEIEGRDEVVSVDDGPRKLITSTSLACVPFVCALKRQIRLGLARHRAQIASLILLVFGILYAYSAISSRSRDRAAVPALVALTLERLSDQANSHAADPETVPEGWISIGQLRDDVLRSEHSIRKREALWQRVKNVVEVNANVRSSQREGRNGEISRVWEWIGAIQGIDSVDRRKSRKSGGSVSWGGYGGEGEMNYPGSDDGLEITQKRWQEGKPIY